MPPISSRPRAGGGRDRRGDRVGPGPFSSTSPQRGSRPPRPRSPRPVHCGLHAIPPRGTHLGGPPVRSSSHGGGARGPLGFVPPPMAAVPITVPPRGAGLPGQGPSSRMHGPGLCLTGHSSSGRCRSSSLFAMARREHPARAETPPSDPCWVYPIAAGPGQRRAQHPPGVGRGWGHTRSPPASIHRLLDPGAGGGSLRSTRNPSGVDLEPFATSPLAGQVSAAGTPRRRAGPRSRAPVNTAPVTCGAAAGPRDLQLAADQSPYQLVTGARTWKRWLTQEVKAPGVQDELRFAGPT